MSKVWSDLKNNTKKKAAKISRAALGTGGGPAYTARLSELEQRVMQIIGPQAATGTLAVAEAGLPQIPVDRNGKLRVRGIYSMKSIDALNSPKELDIAEKSRIDAETAGDNKELLRSNYRNLVPKMSLSLDKGLEKNPRILDLREKLNEISKKKDRNVDKETKGLINGITQLVDEKEQDDSGPYSLLFDLQPATSTFKESIEKEMLNSESLKNSILSINKSAERLPNLLNFDDKQMREFEYSCENPVAFPVTKTFNTHSRSDLCLQLKSQVHPRIFDANPSPNDNSLSRTNEENSLDDSLGILTPDQMDDICYLENAFSPTVEGLPIFCNSINNENKVSPDCSDTPSTDKTESNSAVSTIQNDEFERNDCAVQPMPPNKELVKIDITSSKSCDNLSTQHSVSTAIIPESISCNQIETSDSVGIELMQNIDEEFLPSIHSSILEPVSSIAETTVNLELPLDCKHENRLVVQQRIEQTPSPEDLPLDSSDINGEISTYSQFSSSTLHDSQTYSDNKNDYAKSMETSKVSNSFITSITSITSLDGYQGDGEMSRPVSRAADHSIEPREDVIEMDWQNVPVTRRADPMTDSDFFTESDADGLDDHMHRGDRKAQVIDGALYGGKIANGNPPLIVNRNDDSCMESSGVYTDFENHRTSPVFLNVIDDMSPEGSTPSTHSECSQKNVSSGQINTYLAPQDEIMKEETSKETGEEEKTPKNTSKRNSLNSEKDVRSNAKSKEEKRSFTLKKYKMPKRDVPSKLKTMLASRSPDADNSVQNSPKTVKKPDRRENLTKKNSIDVKTDYKVKSFKDIKSKVDCSFSLQRSQTACSVSRMLSSKSPNTNTKPKSRHMRMRVDLASAAGSGKSSLHSSQSDLSAISTPLGKHPTSRFPLLRNGKKRESAPPQTPPVRAPATPPQPAAQVKKNGVVPKLASSPVAVRPRASLAPPSPRKPAARRTPVQRPTTLPTPAKDPPRVTAAVGPRNKRAPAPARAPPSQAAALAHAAKGVEALGVLVQYLVFRLDALNGGSWRLEAEHWRGVAAAERSTAARADLDRQQREQKDLDTIAECLGKISDLEREVSSKEEANARLQATHMEEVASLANDIKGLKDTIDSLKREVSESRTRLHAHSEIERTLRAQLEAARSEIERANALRTDTACNTTCNTACNTICNKSDAACDPVCCEVEECELRLRSDEELSTDANELAAEVRSLRAVIELKQAEMASLRDARSELAAERERRAACERDARAARHAAEELRERAAARQREADRLRDDNRRLRDAAARDRDNAARVAALNEELRYKLRQKSQVVSLLAGGGYIEAARQRTSSADSLRSPSPDSGSPSPPPAVKAVVEKQDSVSWVLEIEETPEEVATRLARRSSFRAPSSPLAPGGVKRRGGGSPGGSPAPASPAPNASKLFRPGDRDFPPAPPPLKESAGEAIYIYDDTQY